MIRLPLSLLFIVVIVLPSFAGESFEDRLARFETYAVKGMRDWKVPGMSMGVVRNGKLIYAKGFGTRRAGEDNPVDRDTVFQVGSTTKAFTVALMGTLVDEGRVDWDDRVVDHFPDFMMFDPWVTREFRIHDLFAQHSGMPFYAGDLQCFIGFDRQHIVRSMRHIKPSYSFRDKFSYVNNLFVAGALVEESLTGKSWETLMHERILKPLGMTRSSLDEGGLTKAENGSDLHILVDGKAQPIRHGSMLLDWPYMYGPAGGLNSTAPDMAKWLLAQLGNGKHGSTRIFSEESGRYMHTPRTPMHLGEFHGAYCQGWLKTDLHNTDLIWHNGGTSGICSFVGFSPELDLGLVVLTNLGRHKLADALGLQFFDMMSGTESDWSAKFLKDEQQAKKAEEQDTRKVLTLPGLPLDKYAGKYHSPIYGDLTVELKGTSLNLTLGARGETKLVLNHKTMHTFTADWSDMDPADPVYHFDFGVDALGRAVSVTQREFNIDNTVVFTRR